MTKLSDRSIRIILLILCFSILIIGSSLAFYKSKKNKEVDLSLSSATSIYRDAGFDAKKEHSCGIDHSVKFNSRSVCGTNVDIKEETSPADTEQRFQALLDTSLELSGFNGLNALVDNKKALSDRMHTYAQITEQNSGKQCSINIGTTSTSSDSATELYLNIFCAD